MIDPRLTEGRRPKADDVQNAGAMNDHNMTGKAMLYRATES